MMRRFILQVMTIMLLCGSGFLGGVALPLMAEDGPFSHTLYLPLVFKPLPVADLSVSLTSAPRPYVAGAAITYTVTAANTGPGISSAPMVALTLPTTVSNLIYTPSTGDFDPVTGIWQNATLAPGSQITLAIRAYVQSGITSVLQASVAITTVRAFDPDLANNQATDSNSAFPPITDALLNPGFEGITSPGGSTGDTFDGSFHVEMLTPEGWVAWWEEGPGLDADLGIPELMPIEFVDPYITPVPRIRTGDWALKLFTFWRPHRAGLYQTIADLPTGSRASLSAYAHAYSCDREDTGALSCPDDPYQFGFKVGLDPTGGTNPWSDNIVWSDMAYIYDVYDLVGPVEVTVGQEGRITVFLRSDAKWGIKHNDAYWDDIALTITP